jgi:hypothetical protein
MKKLNNATTKLERAAQKIINNHAADYDNGVEGFMRDLNYGGCQSGMVGELVYYHDTLKFYKTHKTEINGILKESMSESGIKDPSDMFGDKWDSDDPLALDTMNQNLLAWFGFEVTAQNLANRAGIEA